MVYEKKMSGLIELPPVWEYWTARDLDNLTKEEIERLQVMLKSKLDVLGDRYERELFWKDRDRYIQLKKIAYREKPTNDFLF